MARIGEPHEIIEVEPLPTSVPVPEQVPSTPAPAKPEREPVPA